MTHVVQKEGTNSNNLFKAPIQSVAETSVLSMPSAAATLPMALATISAPPTMSSPATISAPPTTTAAAVAAAAAAAAAAVTSNTQGKVHDEEDAADQKMLEQLEGSDIVSEVDARSVFVGNVDYGTTPPELQEYFKNCGPINRITIMVDRFTGHPKGYAYIEFQDESAITRAMALNQTMFRERPLKVIPKRKNIPGFNSRGRGRGGNALQMLRAGAMAAAALRGGRGAAASMLGYFPQYRGRAQRAGFPY